MPNAKRSEAKPRKASQRSENCW